MADRTSGTASRYTSPRRAAQPTRGGGYDEAQEAAFLLSDGESAAWAGVSRATFWRRVKDRTFPQPIRIGGSTRWRRDELVAAIDRITAARDQG